MFNDMGPVDSLNDSPVHAATPRTPNWPQPLNGPPSPFPQPGQGYPGGWEKSAAHGSVGGGFGGNEAWNGIVNAERAQHEIRTAGGGQPSPNPPNFQGAGLNASGAVPAQAGLNSPASLANAVRAAGAARMA